MNCKYRFKMKLLREFISQLLEDESSKQAGPKNFTVGYVVDSIKALKEIEEEIAQDQRMLDRLEGCVA